VVALARKEKQGRPDLHSRMQGVSDVRKTYEKVQSRSDAGDGHSAPKSGNQGGAGAPSGGNARRPEKHDRAMKYIVKKKKEWSYNTRDGGAD